MRRLRLIQPDVNRPTFVRAGAFTVALAAFAGCQSPSDHAPPPRETPAPIYEGRITRDPERPLPEPGRAELPPPPFADVPLVSQHAPEEYEFLRAYNGVGRPRIAVFVNRTLEGELVPAGDGRDHTDRVDRTESRGPGRYSQHTDTFLRPGEYDEAWAKNIDYAAVETALTDWLSAGHQTIIVSPSAVRARLNDEEIKKLQSGRPRAVTELAKELDADILVQVQARPTRQIPEGFTGVGVRLIAEAVNTRAGESIARAQTTLPPPLDNPKINDFTRFLARKLMSDMTATWSGPGPERGPAGADGNNPRGVAPPPGSSAPGAPPSVEVPPYPPTVAPPVAAPPVVAPPVVAPPVISPPPAGSDRPPPDTAPTGPRTFAPPPDDTNPGPRFTDAPPTETPAAPALLAAAGLPERPIPPPEKPLPKAPPIGRAPIPQPDKILPPDVPGPPDHLAPPTTRENPLPAPERPALPNTRESALPRRPLPPVTLPSTVPTSLPTTFPVTPPATFPATRPHQLDGKLDLERGIPAGPGESLNK